MILSRLGGRRSAGRRHRERAKRSCFLRLVSRADTRGYVHLRARACGLRWFYSLNLNSAVSTWFKFKFSASNETLKRLCDSKTLKALVRSCHKGSLMKTFFSVFYLLDFLVRKLSFN